MIEKREEASHEKMFPFEGPQIKMVFDESFAEQYKCEKCGSPLQLKTVIPSSFPYVHVDIGLGCFKCRHEYIFGIPANRYAGLALIVWDTNPDIAFWADRWAQPVCPFHGEKMWLTKVFGDWLPFEEKVVVQWKCPECFYCEHKEFERPMEAVPHKPKLYSFSDSEKEALEERLKRLGYLS
jgi:hypothetical protein